jgi:hypothetical protein
MTDLKRWSDDKRLGDMRLGIYDIFAFMALTAYHPKECSCYGCCRVREYEKIKEVEHVLVP